MPTNLTNGIRAALGRIAGPKYAKCASLGISLNTYDKWFHGVSQPTDENLARLARLARVDQEWIRNGGQDTFAAPIRD
jgi:transcriptional regulator with XRE-family HTH domain